MKLFRCAQSGLIRDADAELISYARREKEISLAAKSLREHEIQRVMCQNELESDEFYTAEQKAIAIIKQNKR